MYSAIERSKDWAADYSLELEWYALSCWPGIAIAGFVYPVIFGIGSTLVSIAAILMGNQPDITELIIPIFVIALTSCVGLLLAAILGCFWLLALGFINLTIGRPLSARLLISCSGGLTGFSATYFACFNGPGIAMLVGPLLAILVGQTCVRYWEARVARYSRFQPMRNHRFHFRILNILVLTLWCSLFLLVDRMSEQHTFALLFLAYVVCQIACLLIAALARWITSFFRNKDPRWA